MGLARALVRRWLVDTYPLFGDLTARLVGGDAAGRVYLPRVAKGR